MAPRQAVMCCNHRLGPYLFRCPRELALSQVPEASGSKPASLRSPFLAALRECKLITPPGSWRGSWLAASGLNTLFLQVPPPSQFKNKCRDIKLGSVIGSVSVCSMAPGEFHPLYCPSPGPGLFCAVLVNISVILACSDFQIYMPCSGSGDCWC